MKILDLFIFNLNFVKNYMMCEKLIQGVKYSPLSFYARNQDATHH
jgi:hypothetical protein